MHGPWYSRRQGAIPDRGSDDVAEPEVKQAAQRLRAQVSDRQGAAVLDKRGPETRPRNGRRQGGAGTSACLWCYAADGKRSVLRLVAALRQAELREGMAKRMQLEFDSHYACWLQVPTPRVSLGCLVPTLVYVSRQVSRRAYPALCWILTAAYGARIGHGSGGESGLPDLAELHRRGQRGRAHVPAEAAGARGGRRQAGGCNRGTAWGGCGRSR